MREVFSRREMEAFGEPVGMPNRGPAFGEYLDPVTAAIGIGTNLVGSLIGADASSNAASTQANAANNATQFQQGQWNQIMGNLQPYINQGSQANSRLSDLLGVSGNSGAQGYGALTQPFTAQAFQQFQDPGYQFQLQQGLQALQNSQAAQDGVLSGSALKSLIGYNQGMAQSAYTNAFDRWNATQGNTYQRLAGLAQLGQSSAAGAAASGVNLAGSVANTITGAGNAQAAGQVGVANALSGGLNGAAGYYMLGNLLNKPPDANNAQWTNFGGSAADPWYG